MQKPAAPATPAIVKRPDGRLVAVAGASRSGKTWWTADQVKACKRLLVWDYKGEWSLKYRCRRVHSFDELRSWVKSTAPPARLAFHVPMMKDAAKFDLFCSFAWLWLRQGEGTLVVEETASVTSPGKAPAWWGEILRMGLGYGCNIFALTQRPAESDKTALGNASIVHCHRMNTTDDRIYMGKLLDVELDQVKALKPREWIERHDSGELVTHTTERKKRGPKNSARRDRAAAAA